MPSLILIYRESRDYIPISAGVIALSDIEEKIYRGMKLLKGEKEPENWSLYDFQKGTSAFDVNGGKKAYDNYIKKEKTRK